MSRFFSSKIFCVALLSFSPHGNSQTTTEYLANSTTLALRKQPSWEAPVTGKLMRGEPIRVLNHGEVWATVHYKNQEMFVPFALLSESSPWVVEQKELSSTKIAAQFRKKRFKSRKEIRDTLKNVQKKGALKDESEVIDDPELIAQLSGQAGLETADGSMANPMDDGGENSGAADAQEASAESSMPAVKSAWSPAVVPGGVPTETDSTAVPGTHDGVTEHASRDPAKAKGHAPQSFGPAVKNVEPMKFDLKSIRRMDKYKLTEKDIRRFRAQGKLSGD